MLSSAVEFIPSVEGEGYGIKDVAGGWITVGHEVFFSPSVVKFCHSIWKFGFAREGESFSIVHVTPLPPLKARV